MSEYLYIIPLRELVLPQKGSKPLIIKKKSFPGSLPYLDINTLEYGNANEYTFKELGNVAFKTDILVVWDGSRAGLPLKGRDGVIGSTLMCLTPILIDSDYLYYFLKSRFNFINGNLTPGGIPHVNTELFYNLQVPYMSLVRQKKHVADLERKLKQHNIIIETQKKLINDILENTKIKFDKNQDINITIQNFCKSLIHKSFLGEITKDWRDEKKASKNFKYKAIEDIASIQNGYAYKSKGFINKGEYQVIRLGNVKPLQLNLTNSPIFISKDLAIKSANYKLKNNDILITLTGTKYKRDYGYACLVKTPNNLYVNQRVCRISCGEIINPEYLCYWLQTDNFKNIFFVKETGNASQGNVSAEVIKKAMVPLPSIAEQNEIVHRIKTLLEIANNVKANYEKAVSDLHDYEKAVLQEAFKIPDHEKHDKKMSLEIVLQEILLQKDKVIKEKNIQREQQSTFKKNHFMNNSLENIKTEIRNIVMSEYTQIELSPEVRGVIFEKVASKIPDMDFDDFSSAFQDLVQDKITKDENTPFLISVKNNGKLHYKLNNPNETVISKIKK